MFLPHFSIYSEGGNIADPVTMSLFFQGHADMSWRTNSLNDSLDPSHLVFGESTLLCLGPNLFIFAPMLWTAEIVSERIKTNKLPAHLSCSFCYSLFFQYFIAFPTDSYVPGAPSQLFWHLAQAACLLRGNDQSAGPLWSSELPLYLSDVAQYLVPPQLCRMPSDNDLTYWDGVALVPWLDMVPWTWKVFSSLLTSSCLFWGVWYCNAVGFLLQAQMLNHC